MNAKTEYWLELCDDDLSVSKSLLKSAHFLHCGYFCHQVIEKAFKAVIAEKINEIPPKIHDLSKLANIGGLVDLLSDEQRRIIRKLEPLQIEARYPEYKESVTKKLSIDYCEEIIQETEELLCWIKQLLGK